MFCHQSAMPIASLQMPKAVRSGVIERNCGIEAWVFANLASRFTYSGNERERIYAINPVRLRCDHIISQGLCPPLSPVVFKLYFGYCVPCSPQTPLLLPDGVEGPGENAPSLQSPPCRMGIETNSHGHQGGSGIRKNDINPIFIFQP
jgi:hypothetical protein